MSAKYILRLDDIAPNMHWENYLTAKKMFDQYGIKPVLGVVPSNRDPFLLSFPSAPVDFWNEIRAQKSNGCHIAMHGYQHMADSSGEGFLGFSGKSEFVGHSYERQLDKLRQAALIFDQQGIKIDLFFAPWHSFDTVTLKALTSVGITEVLDGYAFFPYRQSGMFFVPQQIGTPYWFPMGTWTFALHLNTFKKRDFVKLENFFSKHHGDFIAYRDCHRYASNGIFNKTSKSIIGGFLKIKRAFYKSRNEPPKQSNSLEASRPIH